MKIIAEQQDGMKQRADVACPANIGILCTRAVMVNVNPRRPGATGDSFWVLLRLTMSISAVNDLYSFEEKNKKGNGRKHEKPGVGKRGKYNSQDHHMETEKKARRSSATKRKKKTGGNEATKKKEKKKRANQEKKRNSKATCGIHDARRNQSLSCLSVVVSPDSGNVAVTQGFRSKVRPGPSFDEYREIGTSNITRPDPRPDSRARTGDHAVTVPDRYECGTGQPRQRGRRQAAGGPRASCSIYICV